MTYNVFGGTLNPAQSNPIRKMAVVAAVAAAAAVTAISNTAILHLLLLFVELHLHTLQLMHYMLSEVVIFDINTICCAVFCCDPCLL